MQHYTIFFIMVNAVHVSGGFSAHHQELENCKYNIEYMPSLFAATASIYPMLCVQFLSSWWWAEKPPETCTALTVIKNIVYNIASCWLYLKNTLTMHGPINVKILENYEVFYTFNFSSSILFLCKKKRPHRKSDLYLALILSIGGATPPLLHMLPCPVMSLIHPR